MIISDDEHILFIEPKQKAAEVPVKDDLSRKMREAMDAARESDYASLGIHLCKCGAASDCIEWILPTGQITNSLAVHYLEYHRDEIPESELEKDLITGLAE